MKHLALEISISPNHNITKLKYRGLYTWIFNSSDESVNFFLVKESDIHRRSDYLAWKLIATKILCVVKQGIC